MPKPKAVLNVGGFDYLGSCEAQFFARTLDAISAAEVAFLAKHRSVEWFSFTSPREEKSTYYVDSSPIEGALARGLINLGLIVRSRSEGTAGDNGGYWRAPIAKKLLGLIGP